MNTHASSSSLNGEAAQYIDGDEPRESPAFPSLIPLSHDLALLSPAQTPSFSVDDFLVSRTKASDLNYILSDLRSYSEKLKDELYSIINEDYKEFVSLGSSLKAEAHRIARLGWSARPTDAASQDHVPPQGLMAPVRDMLLASRSMLKSVQDDIEDCIRRKEDATSHKAKLELMLQLNDSVVRLEDLLLIQDEAAGKKARRRSSHAARRPSLLSITSMSERRDSAGSIASGSDQELSDYAMSSEYEDETESDDDASSGEQGASKANGHNHQRPSRRKILRRLSSGIQTAHARSSLRTRHSESLSPTRTRTRSETLTTTTGPPSSSLQGLPQRIARTSAEYSRLRFLHRRIDEESLTHFTDALQDRIDNVRSVLRQDVRTLLGALLSPHSLLVHGKPSAREPASPGSRKTSRPTASPTTRRASFLSKTQPLTIHEQPISELDAWSQIAEPVEQGDGSEALYWEARLEEQRSWLEMALSTLNTLTLVHGQGESGEATVKRRNEAEEAVRDLLVADWAANNITVDNKQHTTDLSEQDSLKSLPQAVRARFEAHRTHVDTLLLASSPSNPLVELYNSLLEFVASTAWQVYDASREISHQSTATIDPLITSETNHDARCDIFTNVVWDTLSSRLLDTMGTTIFFVGQTDTFHSNFTLTNTFLQRFLSLAPTEESRLAMQQHPNWLAFKRRWQLPVYFQMRFREVVTQLETQLVDGRTWDRQEGVMQATQATLTAIATLWSAEVHIHELSAREWRVTLQILSRYKTWIEEQSPVEIHANSRQLDAVRTAAADGSSRTSFDHSTTAAAAAGGEISRVSTPQPPADLTVQQQDDEQLSVGVGLVSDCLALRQRVERLLDEEILSSIASSLQLDEDDGAALTALRTDLLQVLATESLDFIPALSTSIGRYAYTILLPRVVAPLRMLRSFSTATHRSGEEKPAIQVIKQMFHPLATFLSTYSAYPYSLPVEIKRSWTQPILEAAFRRYTSTIETINKNQQSLIRLKKSQAPPTTASSASGLLGGLFKASSSSPSASPNLSSSAVTAGGGAKDTVADLERAFAETNRLALATFEQSIAELALQVDLDGDGWTAWIELKRFLLASS